MSRHNSLDYLQSALKSINSKMRDKLVDQIIEHEGLKLKPYHCPAGKLTIGVGRNLEDKGIS